MGLTRVQTRPQPGSGEGAIHWHPHLPVSLSYDHRVINGAEAARFVVAFGFELAKIHFE
jgi:pyruvate dehydrogenase E2 component (dihydrolipoamide acetyltransferase)